MATRLSTRALTGAIIVVIGLLLLLDTTNIAETSEVWRFVPSLFILLGVWALWRSGGRNPTGPLLVIVVAGIVQLQALDLLTDQVIETWWPVVVILVGLSFIVGRPWRTRQEQTGDESVDLFAMFGGVERRVGSQSFRNADCTALFGGTTVDLRDAAVAEKPATVDVLVLFGGAEVVVPEDWGVAVDVVPIFGGTDDERRRVPESTGDPDLRVTGLVGFGGVTIK